MKNYPGLYQNAINKRNQPAKLNLTPKKNTAPSFSSKVSLRTALPLSALPRQVNRGLTKSIE